MGVEASEPLAVHLPAAAVAVHDPPLLASHGHPRRHDFLLPASSPQHVDGSLWRGCQRCTCTFLIAEQRAMPGGAGAGLGAQPAVLWTSQAPRRLEGVDLYIERGL